MRSALWRQVAAATLATCTAVPVLAQDDLDFLLAEPSDEAPSGDDSTTSESAASPEEESNAADGSSGGGDPPPATDGDAAAVSPELYDTIPVLERSVDAAPEPARPKRVIEEIVVTAQKTEQTLRDVPISVSAIGGEQVKEAAITETQELVQYTPNVKFSSGANNIPSVTIRGFGSPPLGRSLEPSVGLSIDDVFYGRSTFTNDAVFDIQRLEVLRGPQGTLFGKNTIAGVLNFTTAAPSFDPEGYVTLASGSLEERRVEGGVGFPVLDEILAARISFRARDRHIGVYNTTRKEDGRADDITGRLKLRWLIDDDLTADAGYFTSNSNSTGVGFQLEKASERSLQRYRRIDPETEANAFDGRQSLDAVQSSGRSTEGLSLKLQQDIASFGFIENLALAAIIARASSEAPYAFDTDFSPINIQRLTSAGPERYDQDSLELRTSATTPALFGWGESMDWIVGAYGIRTDSNVTQLSTFNRNGLIDVLLAGGTAASNIPTLPAGLVAALNAAGLPSDISQIPSPPTLFGPTSDEEFVRNILHVENESVALFTQTTWHLNDQLSMVLGLRYGRERGQGAQSSQCTAEAGSCFGGPIFAGQRNFSTRGSRSESDFSPKIALSYDINDAITVFANITRGFKSGGFSGPLLSPRNLQYGPETARSIEAGVKSRLLDGSLVLNATVYQVAFDNMQVQVFDGVNISTLNAASATSRGLELDFQWLPSLEFLTLAGSVGFSDVAYDDFPCGPAQAGDTDTSAQCNPRNERDAPATQDLSGRETPFSPKVSASLTPSVKFPLLPGLGIGALFGNDILHQGEQFLDTDLDPQTRQDATTKINARFGIKPMEGPWAIIANAKNLTGEKERVLVLDQPQMRGNYVSISLPDEPLYSVDLRYTFGETR